MDQPTITLGNGTVVAAKTYKGEAEPIRYANRTQAQALVDKLGDGWAIYRWSSFPFYVGRVK